MGPVAVDTQTPSLLFGLEEEGSTLPVPSSSSSSPHGDIFVHTTFPLANKLALYLNTSLHPHKWGPEGRGKKDGKVQAVSREKLDLQLEHCRFGYPY